MAGYSRHIVQHGHNRQIVFAAEEWPLIRQSLQRGQLTGNSRFVDEIARKIERRVEFRGP
jgi:putative transposase